MARKRRGGDSSSLRVGGGSVNTSFRGDIGSSQRGDSNSLQAGGGLGQAVSASRGGGGGGGSSRGDGGAAARAAEARAAESARQAALKAASDARAAEAARVAQQQKQQQTLFSAKKQQQSQQNQSRVYGPQQVIRVAPTTSNAKGIYSPFLGGYVTNPQSQGTAIFRPTNAKEQNKMQLTNVKANAIVAVPAQYFGTIFNKQLSPELAAEGAKGNFGQRALTFLNPKYQLKIAEYNEQLRQDTLSSLPNIKKLTTAEKDYNSGKITGEQYNSVYSGISSQKDFKNVYGTFRQDTFQAIAGSKLSEKQKGGVSFGIRTVQTVPYFFAPTRAVLGADIARESALNYPLAQTKTEKALTIGQGTLGVALAYSGLKGTFLPKASPTSITGTAGQVKAFKVASYTSGTVLGGSIGALDYYTTLKSTGSKSVALGAGLGSGTTLIGGLYGPKVAEIGLFGKKPYKVIPTAKMESDVQPFTRQRATLMLKDFKGKYVLGKTKSGEAISIGGGIEKGQTSKQAVIAELFQETGLKLKDLTNFKKSGKVVFPEETNFIFTATLPKGTKLNPKSDINKIVTISPKNPFIKKSTGQTALQPTSRYVPLKGRVRSYEAGIINFLETGQRPTWLGISTKQGEFLLGTQSRYNVPFKYQSKYLSEKNLLLAHGTQESAVLKKSIFGKEKSFIVEGSKTKRGQAQGLYVQPPISTALPKEGYTFYHGTTSSAAKNILKSGLQTGESLGLMKGPGSKPIKVSASGAWKEVFLTTELEQAKGYGEVLKVFLTKKQVAALGPRSFEYTAKGFSKGYKGPVTVPYNIPANQVSTLKGNFNLPGESAPGYIGLSYLGLNKGGSGEVILGSAKGGRAAFLFSESPKKVIPTPKTFSGAESEFIVPPKSTIRTTGKAEVASIGFKKVYLQPAEIGGTSIGGKGKPTIVSGSSGLGKDFVSIPRASAYSSVTSSSYNPAKTIVTPSYSSGGGSSYAKSPVYSSGRGSGSSKSPTLKSISSGGSSVSKKSSSVVFSPSSSKSVTSSVLAYKYNYGGSSTNNPRDFFSPKPTGRSGGFYLGGRSQKPSSPTFGVQVRRGGVFRSIGSGLSLGKALELGTLTTGGTLAATFKLSGEGVGSLTGASFATPSGFKKKKSKKGETLFIEKKSLRLSKRSETSEIQSAKRKRSKKKK